MGCSLFDGVQEQGHVVVDQWTECLKSGHVAQQAVNDVVAGGDLVCGILLDCEGQKGVITNHSGDGCAGNGNGAIQLVKVAFQNRLNRGLPLDLGIAALARSSTISAEQFATHPSVDEAGPGPANHLEQQAQHCHRDEHE